MQDQEKPDRVCTCSWKCIARETNKTLNTETRVRKEWLSVYLIQIAEDKFEIDDINVRFGINFVIHMNNVIVLKTSHHLKAKHNEHKSNQ